MIKAFKTTLFHLETWSQHDPLGIKHPGQYVVPNKVERSHVVFVQQDLVYGINLVSQFNVQFITHMRRVWNIYLHLP